MMSVRNPTKETQNFHSRIVTKISALQKKVTTVIEDARLMLNSVLYLLQKQQMIVFYEIPRDVFIHSLSTTDHHIGLVKKMPFEVI